MSGIIGSAGTKSGVIRAHANESNLWHLRYVSTGLTINSSAQAITDLACTYSYERTHALHITGCLTMTSSAAFDSHVGILLNGTQIGSPDQHYTPDGEWWYMSWSFMSATQTAGTHAVTVIGTNQMSDWNIIASAANSQQVVRIIPQ
jgi:hypothetical protein